MKPNPTFSKKPSAASWLAVVCLATAIILAYFNSLHAAFLFDDTGAVTENPTIRRLVSFAPFHPPDDGSTTTGRPVVNLSFAINYSLSGNQVWSYHALNIAIHALAALALMGIVRRTLLTTALRERFGADARWLAFLVALVWALHPLQTESVVCIAQRTESLCGLFYLFTVYAFIRGTSTGPENSASRGWLAVSLVACLAGMGTKEVMATAPLMVLLFDRTFLAGGFLAALRRRAGYYAALACTWLLLAWLVWHSGGARGSAAGFGLGISGWAYLLKQCEALVLYLKLSFWPHPLVLDYGTAVIRSAAEVWWQGACVLLLLAATFWALVRKPVLGFAGAWFFVVLAPSSSVVPLVTQTMAEHRMYLSLAVVVVVVVLGAYARIGRNVRWVCGALALLFGVMTVVRNGDYRDGVTIWTDTVSKYPQNARAHNNLAWALQQQGKSEAANSQFAQAIALQPDYIAAHYSWGVALLDQRRTAEAIAQFEIAVKLAPQHADAHINLGNALMQVHRTAEAIPHYEEALRLRPAADARYNLGVALNDVGRNDEARLQLQAALQENPSHPETYYWLARVAEDTGRFAEAEHSYAEALRLSPDDAAAHARLGLLLTRSGRLDAAAVHLQTAVRLSPSDPDALAYLGTLLLLEDRPREAIASYEESLRLRPGDARTLENLQLAREALKGK